MTISQIVFWEPCVSPHKAHLFKAIKECHPNINFLHIAQTDISADRRAMGWISPEPDTYDEIIAPDKERCLEIAAHRPAETFHVFSGIRHVPCIIHGLRAVQHSGAKFAIMSEPRVNEGIRGVFRYLQSWLTEGALRRQATCIFAIGSNGSTWFHSVGYPQLKVFPFAYFIDQLAYEADQNPVCTKSLHVGYLGRIARSKGIFTLLDAMSQFEDREAMLSIAGPLQEDSTSFNAAVDSCLSCVSLKGNLSMSKVADFLADLDVLVLPSITKDGWGVVVTEALMIGVPVVVTTCVGASLVVNDQRIGVVVSPSDPFALAAAIRHATKAENRSEVTRAWRRNWARKHLSANAGAKYFWSVLDHRLNGVMRPAPFYE